MSDSAEFRELLTRLRQGDQAAAAEMYGRYAAKVVRLARYNMGKVLSRRVDPEDVALSAYRTAILRLQDGRLEAENWDALWRLLFRITINKCRGQADRQFAQRRDARRESPLQGNQDDSDALWEPAARETAPVEALMLLETIDDVLRSLSDPRHRQIVQLRLEECSQNEISEQVGVSERTVQRVLQQVHQRLQERLNEP